MKEIVVSGIRSTGNLHLGNYYGALRNFVKMQEESKYNSYFFIADLHALTTHPDPKTLHENVRNILCEYLAAGLDPEKSTLFVQSDVPEISEMYLLMNMHVGIGELMRTASFKDKARKQLGIKTNNDEDIEHETGKGRGSGKSVRRGFSDRRKAGSGAAKEVQKTKMVERQTASVGGAVGSCGDRMLRLPVSDDEGSGLYGSDAL